MKIRHIVTIYLSQKIYPIAKHGKYLLEQIGPQKLFEVSSPTLQQLISSLTNEENEFLATCGYGAYYPEHLISPLTFSTDENRIKGTDNGYYEISFEFINWTTIRLLEWFQPLLRLIWNGFAIRQGKIILGHCPLNILPDILRLLFLICDHSLTIDLLSEPESEPCWLSLCQLESYQTNLDFKVGEIFLTCVGLNTVELKPKCRVNQFLKQIMIVLHSKFGQTNSEVGYYTRLYVGDYWCGRPKLWNVARRQVQDFIEKFEIDPVSGKFRQFLLILWSLFLELDRIDYAALKFWVRLHYSQYGKRLDYILEYLSERGNLIEIDQGINRVLVRQCKG